MKNQLDDLGISAFCESMAMMIHAGIHTDEALDLLTRTGTGLKHGGPLDKGLEVMKESLAEGGGLSLAMEKTGLFPEYALRMVRAGEDSGRLEDVLFKLSRYYADQKEISEQLHDAVTYPIAMIMLIIAILTIMLTMVLPAFGDVYNNLTGSLAESGYGYIHWSYVFCWIALGVMIVLLILAVIGIILWRTGHRRMVESVIRKIPACRNILDEMGLYRFIQAFGLYLSSGDVQDDAAIKSCSMTDCRPVEEKLERVIADMSEGRSFASAAGDEELLEPVYARMLLAGERSGDIEKVLSHLADLLRESYSHRIDRLVGIIDPVLSGVLILTIGLSLLSMMLPLIGMMNAVG